MSLILAPTRSIVRPKPLVGTQIDRGHPLARGLVGAWLMNEGAGSVVRDVSGNGYTGAITSATWSPGRFGTCLAMGGSGTVNAGDIEVLDGCSALTISIWCMATTLGFPDIGVLVNKDAGSARSFYLRVGTKETLSFGVYNSDGTLGSTTSDAFWKSDAGTWRHIVGVWDGTTVSAYINGVLNGTPGSLSGVMRSNAYSVGIGTDWPGSIDGPMVWRRALTASEIQSLYRDPYQMFRRGNPVVLGASSANNYSFTINDGMGIGDDMGGAAAMLRGLSEAMGLGDDVSRAAAIQRAMSEAMGLTDTAARVATVLRALADSVGLTDETIEGAARQLVETINDAVGLTDAQSRLSVLVRAVADSLGMADAATTLAVLLRTISDAQGMTDGQTLARMIAVADDLGVSDEMGRIVAYLRGQSDSVGLSDTMTRLHAAVRQITDTEGLTDSYSTAWTVLRTIADTLGLTDAMIQEGTGALVRVINDVLGMVDAKTKLHAALRVLASTINTADSVSRLFAVSRVISDAEGITDGAYLGKVFTFAETIGISDEVTRLVAFLRTQDDTVGVLEAILKVSNVIRSLDDAIEMTDAEQHSLGGLVQAALAFLFLKKGR